MSLNLLSLPSEIIALIGESLEYHRDIKAFIEAHPRFCCLAQLYESLYGAGNIFVHADGLMAACNNGDETLARGKLKAGALPWGRYCFSRHYTDISYPLPTAARNGYYGVVKAILEYSDPLVPHSEKFEFVLIQAIKAGSTEIVKLLLGIKDTLPTDLRQRSQKRFRYVGSAKPGSGPDTPLNTAISWGNEELTRLLLNDGRFAFNMSSLGVAAAVGSDSMVKMILGHSHLTRTAIADAARGGHMSTLKILLQDGRLDVLRVLHSTGKVDMESLGEHERTPLSYAAEGGNPEAVAFLLAQGANPDCKDSKGRTPLSYAAAQCNSSVVKLLLATGKVDVNSKDLRHKRTPLHWAMQILPPCFWWPFSRLGDKGEGMYCALRDSCALHESEIVLLWKGSQLAPLEDNYPCTQDMEWRGKPHILWDPLGVFRQLTECDDIDLEAESKDKKIGTGETIQLWLKENED